VNFILALPGPTFFRKLYVFLVGFAVYVFNLPVRRFLFLHVESSFSM
jgi:hypothetical protein